MTSASHGTVLVVAVFAWAFYRRIRRNIGRQLLRPRRIIFSMVILSIVTILILSTALAMPSLALGFAGGALLGVVLALVGLRLTRFETTDAGHFYTPNIYIGVALSMLLLGRMAWRFLAMQDQSYQMDHPQAFQSPLTLFLLGLTIGYYLAFYVGLFVHTHDKKPAGTISGF